MEKVYSVMKPHLLKKQQSTFAPLPALQHHRLQFKANNPYELLDGLCLSVTHAAGPAAQCLLRSRSEQGLKKIMQDLELSAACLQSTERSSIFAVSFPGHRSGLSEPYALCLGRDAATGIYTLSLQQTNTPLQDFLCRALRKPLDRWYYQMQALGLDADVKVLRKHPGMDAGYVLQLKRKVKPMLLQQVLQQQHETANEVLILLRFISPVRSEEPALVQKEEEPLYRGSFEQHWMQVFRKLQTPGIMIYFGAGLFLEEKGLSIEFKVSYRSLY